MLCVRPVTGVFAPDTWLQKYESPGCAVLPMAKVVPRPALWSGPAFTGGKAGLAKSNVFSLENALSSWT